MSERPGLRSLLLPLVPLYGAGLAWREARLRSGREAVRRLTWPVVSIGNLSTGGAGKTPLAIALAGELTRRGVHVDVLSRGYGRTGREAARVDPEGSAEQFGDEPLVIAREAGVPVYVAPQRYQAGLLAEQQSPAPGALAVHLLDDGFQHRQLARDVDVLLLSEQDWQDRLLPAGNLREPRSAIRRAGVIALPAEQPALEPKLRAFGWTGPVWWLHRRMTPPQVAGRVIAFCGIARPRQFFAGLQAAGLQVASRVVFRDHHRYVQHDLDCLLDAARGVGATALVTTEKDQVRFGALTRQIPAALALHTARLTVQIQDPVPAVDWLLKRLTHG